MNQELLKEARSGRRCVIVPDDILNNCSDEMKLEVIFRKFIELEPDDFLDKVLSTDEIPEGIITIVNSPIVGLAVHFYPNETSSTESGMPT